ncbi:MAG: hypothetical protein IJX65_02980 [Alistipes sp.]|nr:hypothetical protein [Alistipes sp.]
MIITDQKLSREQFVNSVSADNTPVYQVVPMDMADFDSVTAGASTYYGFKYHSNMGFSKALIEQIRSELEQYSKRGYQGIVLNILVPKGAFPRISNVRKVLEAFYPTDSSLQPLAVWGITSTDALVRRQVEIVGAFTLSD